MDDKKLQQSILDEIKIDNAQVMKANIKADYLEKKRTAKTPWYKNKLFYGILTPVLAASVAFAFIVPHLPGFTVGGGSVDIIKQAKSSENIFAYQTLTSIGMLDASPDTVDGLSLASLSLNDNEMSTVQTYLPVADSALKGESILGETLSVESDLPEYKVKLVITLDENETITMYYNETLILDEDEESEEGEDGENDEDNSEEIENDKPKLAHSEEDESEFTIEGIIKMNDLTYTLEGSREIDPTDNELEIELSYFIDANNYVTVAQEIENDESSFEYIIVENGIEKYEYSLSAEEDTVEIEVVENNIEIEMEFSNVIKNEKSLIMVEYKTNDKKVISYFEKREDQYIQVEI